MTRATMPALIALAGIALSGCATLETTASASLAGAEADRMAAEAGKLSSETGLAAAQAMSATLANQGAQVTRLVDATLAQSATWQSIAIMQAGALALIALALIVAAVAVLIALARRRPAAQAAPVVYIVAPAQAPMIGAAQAADWPELPEARARRRALAQLAPPNTNARA